MIINKTLWKKTIYTFVFLLLGFLPLKAQTEAIKGTVTDQAGDVLIGVSVALKGASLGTTTNLDGEYNFNIPSKDNNILVFTYVGFKTQEVVLVAGQSKCDIVMESSIEDLDEIVVVGYGVQKKANLTGAVSAMRISDIKDIPVSNTSSLLQGRMSGVTVSSFSAQPGKDNDVEIRIRGIGTFGNSSPLILIDGVEGSLSSVAPNDIESISVLKDAASAAIYGVRAANGVILVTTKRGTGDRRISYSGSFGIQKATTLPKYVDSWQWATLFNEQNNALGGDAPNRNYSEDMIESLKNGTDRQHFANTNWMKELFHTASVQNHHLSIASGSETSSQVISVGYMKQEGIMKGTDTDRLNFRLNTDSKHLNMIQVGANVAGSYQNVLEPLGGTSNIFQRTVDKTRPTVPVKYNNGQWGQYDGNPNFTNYISNPLEMTTYQSKEHIYKFDGKAFLDIEPIKNLHYKTSFAFQYNQGTSRAFTPTYRHYKSDGNFITSGITGLEEDRVQQRQWINENLLTYNLNIQESHEFNFLLGHSFQYNGNRYATAKGENFISNNVQEMDGANASSAKGYSEEAKLRSFFGRINYAYQNRYLLEVNLRRDESSRIPKKNRAGYFPSVSAGWNIAQESFMLDQENINMLKLRASWGKLGNQDIGYYPYLSTYTTAKNNYIWGTGKVLGAAKVSADNPDIKWETTTTTNIGLDASFLKSKINLTLDYFNKVSSDILLQLPVSSIVGVEEAPFVNAAEVKNRGWDMSLGYNDKWNDFSFGATFNLSYVKNEITNVNGRDNWINGWTINLAGHPIGSYYGYVANGLYTPQQIAAITDEEGNIPSVAIGKPRPGDVEYLNVDGSEDGKLTDADRAIIGNPFPKVTYSLNLTGAYKNFDLTMFFQGVGNVDRIVMDRPYVEGGVTQKMWGRYHEVNNPGGTYPALGNVGYNELPSSYWIEDASYLRMKNLELGYTFPKTLLNKIKIQGLRVFVSAQNLFTITDVKNYDPEKYSTDSRNWTYPNAKTYSIGLNFSL